VSAGNPTDPTPVRARANATARRDWAGDFIEALCRYGVVQYACDAVGIHRSTAYELRKDDEAFQRAWDEACQVAADALEQEAWRRAVEGVDEPVFQGGERVGSVRRYSDTLLMFLLRARRPETFRETHRHEVGGVGDAAIHFVLSPGEQHGKTAELEE
jgi:hypothetical protein